MYRLFCLMVIATLIFSGRVFSASNKCSVAAVKANALSKYSETLQDKVRGLEMPSNSDLTIDKIGGGASGSVWLVVRADAKGKRSLIARKVYNSKGAATLDVGLMKHLYELQVRGSLGSFRVARVLSINENIVEMEYIEGVNIQQWESSGDPKGAQLHQEYLSALAALRAMHRQNYQLDWEPEKFGMEDFSEVPSAGQRGGRLWNRPGLPSVSGRRAGAFPEYSLDQLRTDNVVYDEATGNFVIVDPN